MNLKWEIIQDNHENIGGHKDELILIIMNKWINEINIHFHINQIK